MEMNTIQINVDTYKSMLKELGVLKTENEELKKRISTSHKNVEDDYNRRFRKAQIAAIKKEIKMNQFKCDKCDAHCIVTVPNKSQHSNKKKPDGCIYSVISLCTNESIAMWKKMPPQDTKGVAKRRQK